MRHFHFAALLPLLASSAPPAAAQGPLTRRVSVASNGMQANGFSDSAAIARGGACVVFSSAASNLVAGDTNGKLDVFVHDLVSGLTTRESVSSAGVQSSGHSGDFAIGISANGRFVVFSSYAPDLVAGDTNQVADVFLRDRVLGTTIRVSINGAGQEGTGDSLKPSVSDDGRYVAFQSAATNFANPDANTYLVDVFVHDTLAGTTTLVGVNAAGAQASMGSYQSFISGDGRFVAFRSDSANMVPAGAYPQQLFVRDLALATTSIESVSSAGVIGNDYSMNPFLSTDGRFLVFQSAASNLVSSPLTGLTDGFLRERSSGTTLHVTVAHDGTDSNGITAANSVSDDGRYVLFAGTATNILPFYNYPVAGNQVWLRDLRGGDNVPIGVDYVYGQALGAAAYGLSADGRLALFRTGANNVVPGDTNASSDFFVRSAPFEAPIYYCTPKVNSLGCTPLILAFGNSSASHASGFQIQAAMMRNLRPGLLLYSVSGRAAIPFAGGTLCLATVHRNTPGSSSGGTAAPVNDCSGNYSLDMNAFAAGLLGGPPLPALSAPGNKVQCQWWSRDPGFPVPNAIGLTGGIEYTVGT